MTDEFRACCFINCSTNAFVVCDAGVVSLGRTVVVGATVESIGSVVVGAGVVVCSSVLVDRNGSRTSLADVVVLGGCLIRGGCLSKVLHRYIFSVFLTSIASQISGGKSDVHEKM